MDTIQSRAWAPKETLHFTIRLTSCRIKYATDSRTKTFPNNVQMNIHRMDQLCARNKNLNFHTSLEHRSDVLGNESQQKRKKTY